MLGSRKVFKHRFYYTNKYGQETAYDEVETWEEAQQKWEKYGKSMSGLYMVSKYFDTMVMLPADTE